MLTDRQKRLVDWLRKQKVATMKRITHQFQLSHITVVRDLKEYGYLTSYNHNAAFYTLNDVPQFDEHGLWSYRKIRFSKFGTLTDTVVDLVQIAPAGMTVVELELQLNTKVANLLSRLVRQERLTQRSLARRQAAYLAADAKQADRQFRQRQKILAAVAHPPDQLSAGLDADLVIQILRQMVLAPDAKPNPLARQLARRDTPVTAGQVRQVIQHYALEKKRHRWP